MVFLCLVNHNEQSDFLFHKNNMKFIYHISLYKIVLEKVCNISKFPIKTYIHIEINHFAFICTNCTRVQICSRVQINLLHLESRSKFAPVSKFAPGSKFLKHHSHDQKYTRVQIVHMNPALESFFSSPLNYTKSLCFLCQII